MIALERIADPVDDRAEFLREQLEYLADELWHRTFRPHQRIWTSKDCPWCRRKRESGLSHVACPICEQVKRTRRSQREDAE